MSEQPKTYDLWITSDCLLTIGVDASLKGFTPHHSHHKVINDTIRDLACAVRPCTYAAENDTGADTMGTLRSIEAIASAIIVLTQLSTAVQAALDPAEPEAGHDRSGS